ncbi:MAG TPA: glycosyltransferase family 39 protein [Bryobacteraceae bacterium]|nr:glycosyltransferase family 39 protein [Bryobacteraceae bacterium]
MAAGTRVQPEGVTRLRDRAALQLAVLLALVFLIRLPFIDQAFQLDDGYYLAGAKYVQGDPAHPWRTTYVYLGEQVDMRGHPHPPLNVWALGAVLAVLGSIREVPFHAAYLFWTLLAVAAAYSLARRFSPHPFLATLMFAATPALVVHGNALEADVPFTALWLAGTAAFVCGVDARSTRWLWAAATAIALASLAAYQVVLLGPILAAYGFLTLRRTAVPRRWVIAVAAVCLLPFAVVGAWQMYQRLSDGALPAAVLMGHFRNYGLQSLANKTRSTLALTGHMAWLIFPALAIAAFARLRAGWLLAIAAATAAAAWVDPHPLFWMSFAIGLVILAYCATEREPETLFLRIWVLLFFAGALAIFYAGAARYILPIALPVAVLATWALRRHPRWIAASVAAQFVFSLALAKEHYDQSNAYRDFARSAKVDGKLWINGEWGLQFYGQQAGGRPMLRAQQVQPGDWVMSNRLGYPGEFATPGGELRLKAERSIVPSVPLRIIGLSAKSAFSTISFGVRPFDITNSPADVLSLQRVEPRVIAREHLTMNDSEAPNQIGSGVFTLEANRWRWTAGKAEFLLKQPGRPARLEAVLYIPDNAPARRVTLALNGAVVAERTLPGPGAHTIASDLLPAATGTATATLTVDRTFSPPGDTRKLGVILLDFGFR